MEENRQRRFLGAEKGAGENRHSAPRTELLGRVAGRYGCGSDGSWEPGGDVQRPASSAQDQIRSRRWERVAS